MSVSSIRSKTTEFAASTARWQCTSGPPSSPKLTTKSVNFFWSHMDLPQGLRIIPVRTLYSQSTSPRKLRQLPGTQSLCSTNSQEPQ
eukprot:Skav236614  [mRNA]  locus=scaffold1476:104828:111226:+ [translate_table: standard]